MTRSLDELRDATRTVVGITVTPFSEDGEIDEASYRRIVTRAVDGGIVALTPNGNTSEFYSLSPAERRRSVELTIEAAPDALIVAGVGLDAATAIDEARYYQSLGAESIMIHQPVLPFWSPDGWVEYHRQIAAAVPELGVIPYLRDPRIGAEEMNALLDASPNVIAVKFAVTDPARFAAVAAAVGDSRVVWICGVAEIWAPFFAMAGAQGFTSGLINVDPARSLRMFENLRNRDYPAAMQEWAAVTEFEELRARRASEFNVTVVKEALAQLGLCRRDVRAPLSLLPDTDRDSVTRMLTGWGFSPVSSN